MKIEYHILWFEDQVRWLNSIKSRLSNFLEDLGFELIVTKEINGDNVDELLKKIDNKQMDVDLILMDFKLSSNDKGNVLIDKIRKNELFTEIIFYSQSGDVRNEVNNLEGVYFSDRRTFFNKTTKVINNSIKKIQDVNNMRGLVIAETSELDVKLMDIIINFLKKDNKKLSDKKKEEILKKLIKNRTQRLKSLEKINISKADDLYNGLESYDKLRAVFRLIKHRHNETRKDTFISYTNILSNYKKQVMDIRNILAHVKEDTDKKGNKILKSTLKGYENFIFNEDMCIKIRKNLIKHSENLENILNKI